MRLGILGDIHGHMPGSDVLGVDFAVQLTETLELDAFLQVGDMCHYRSFARPLYWIIGNNDWPDVVRQVESGERPLANFHNLPTGEVATLAAGGETVRVAGLNGAYDPLYFDLDPAAPRPLESLAYFLRADVDRCLDLADVDIFLAHGCPAGLGYGREPDYGVPAIRDILDAVQPRVMFCGHAHFYREARSGASAVYSLEELKHAYYVFDTATGVLERFPSRVAA